MTLTDSVISTASDPEDTRISSNENKLPRKVKLNTIENYPAPTFSFVLNIENK